MTPSRARTTRLIETLLDRRMLVALTLLMTYGAGLWLNVLHEVEGATEPGAPPAVLHWLRDSTLSLPLVAVGVFLGAMLTRRLLERYGPAASDLVVAGVATAVVALYASAVLSIGNPIHGALFGAEVHGGGNDLPVLLHVVRDGLLALSANEVLAAVLVAGVVARPRLATLKLTLGKAQTAAS